MSSYAQSIFIYVYRMECPINNGNPIKYPHYNFEDGL